MNVNVIGEMTVILMKLLHIVSQKSMTYVVFQQTQVLYHLLAMGSVTPVMGWAISNVKITIICL